MHVFNSKVVPKGVFFVCVFVFSPSLFLFRPIYSARETEHVLTESPKCELAIVCFRPIYSTRETSTFQQKVLDVKLLFCSGPIYFTGEK